MPRRVNIGIPDVDAGAAVATGIVLTIVGKIRERYAIAQEEAQRQVDAWLDRL